MPLFKRRQRSGKPTTSVLDMFLKIDGIEGESEDKGHAKETRVLDFEFFASNPGSSPTGKGGGKVEFNDAGFLLELDKAVIGALQAGTGGKHLKSAVFTARKAGGGQHDYLIWTFSDLILSMVMVQDPSRNGPVLAFVALNFSKVEVEYKEQKADGSVGAGVRAGWDLAKNEKV